MVPSSRGRWALRTAVAVAAALALVTTAACSSDDGAPTGAGADVTSPAGTPTTSTSASPSGSASPTSATPTARPKKKQGAGATTKPSATATATPSATRTRTKAGKGAATRTRKPTTKATPRGPQLTVSRTKGLDPDRQRLTIKGTGFDPAKGIYVALCVEPPKGKVPSPCGGGVDTSGTSGTSTWISSNPPPYGQELAIPYGKNGSFSVTVTVSSRIGDLDCRRTSCVIASRNDHTRSSDRSQDVFVPVTFAKR